MAIDPNTPLVTPPEVRAVYPCPETKDLTPFISTAHLIVYEQLSSKITSEQRLHDIELYLSAHFASLSDGGQIVQDKAGDASTTYARPTQSGMYSTGFGQTAILLDPTGTLIDVTSPKQKARFILYGPSTSPYVRPDWPQNGDDSGSAIAPPGPSPSPPSNLDSLVEAWIAKCVVQPTDSEVTALNYFIVTLRGSGILDKLSLVNIMCGPDQTVGVLNLLALDSPGWTQINAPQFAGGVGFTMDGTSHLQHPDMYYQYVSALDATALLLVSGPESEGQDLGAYLGSQTVISFDSTGRMVIKANSDTPATTPVTLTALIGFSRNDPNTALLVKNGVAVAASAPMNAVGYGVMTLGRYSTRTYSLLILGQYLSPSDHQQLWFSVRTYARSLGIM